MRIVVAVKYVPDINADRRFEDGRLFRDPGEGTLNELDENAIEAALAIRDEAGAGGSEVIAITMGPEAATGALRKAFQLGVDRAIRLTDDALVGADYFATAKALAAVIDTLSVQAPVDLVICGMAALDGQGSVVPTLVAAELALPALLLAADLAVDATARTATVTRELDGVTEVLTAPLPAVVSVTDHANTVRMPNFQLIMAARSKKPEAWSLADAGIDAATIAADGARTRVVAATPRPPRPEAELVVDKGDGGRALANFLIRNELV